jgi:anti-anti-sigma factor
MDLVIHKEGSAWRALFKGQFTFSDNARFRELLDGVVSESPKQVVLDVAQVSYVDSAALGMLLLLREAAETNNTNVIIAGANGQVLKILELSRFHDLFEMI